MSDEVSQFVGVDWSGAGGAAGQRAAIWLAVVRDGALCELTPGLTRIEAVERVIALAGVHPRTVVGLDFAFSLPRWWLAEQGFAAADEVWRWAAAQAEADRHGWLRELPEPFWGTRFRLRPTDAFGAGRPELRVTEQEARDSGAAPMSTFRLFGPGTVGAQGLRGHPCLLRLQEAGFSIWPFEPPAWPLVVEVYPRLLVRQLAPALARLRAAALRAAFLEAATAGFTRAGADAEALRANGDAFDAAVTAWALWHGRATLAFLPLEEPVEDYRLEGRIWRLPDEALEPGSPLAQWQVPEPASVNDLPETGRNFQS